MASFTDKELGAVYKDILHTSNSNTGISTTIKQITCGDGDTTALHLSSQNLKVQPGADSTTNTVIYDTDGNALVTVDSTNDLVKAGIGQHTVNTQFKEFGLHDFSPTAGYHNPMVAGNMMFSDSGDDIIEDQSMFSNGTDPATTLDVSANGTPSSLVACTWFIQSNMTIDEVRVIATCNSTANLDFHLYSYTLDTSSAHGDLSAGTLLAHNGSSLAATNATMKTATLTVDSANVDANKVVYAFVENSTNTGDVTCQLLVKYHLR